MREGGPAGLGQRKQPGRAAATAHLAAYGTLGDLVYPAGGGHGVEVAAHRRGSQPEQVGQRGRADRAVLEQSLAHPVAGTDVGAIAPTGGLDQADRGFHNAHVT